MATGREEHEIALELAPVAERRAQSRAGLRQCGHVRIEAQVDAAALHLLGQVALGSFCRHRASRHQLPAIGRLALKFSVHLQSPGRDGRVVLADPATGAAT